MGQEGGLSLSHHVEGRHMEVCPMEGGPPLSFLTLPQPPREEGEPPSQNWERSPTLCNRGEPRVLIPRAIPTPNRYWSPMDRIV